MWVLRGSLSGRNLKSLLYSNIRFAFRGIGNVSYNIGNAAAEHFTIGINFAECKIVVILQPADFGGIETEVIFQIINSDIFTF